MPGIGVPAATARRRLVLVLCALVAAAAFAVVGQLNDVLASMRVGGGVAASIDDLTVRLVPFTLPSEVDVRQVVESWQAYDAAVVAAAPELGYAGPLSVANAVLRWDSLVLLPALALLALTLLLWARRWPAPPPGQPVPRAVVALARSWFLFGVLAATVVATVVQNLTVSRLLDQAWDGKPLRGDTMLVLTGLVRWAGWLLVLAPFLVVGARSVASLVRPVVRTAWFPLLLLVALGVATVSGQAAEVVRRWGVGQVVWTLLGVALLAVAVGFLGSRSFQIGRTPVVVRAQGSPLTLAAFARAALRLLPLAVVAVVLLLAGRTLEWRGLFVLALLVAVAYLLSLPIRHFWDGEQLVEVPTVQTAPAPLRQRIGAVLAAVVPFLVGLAVVRAAVTDVFYRAGDGVDRDVVLLVLGLALVVGGSLAAASGVGAALRWLAGGGRVRRWGTLGALAVAVALPSALLALRSTSLGVAQGIGTAAVVLVFLSLLAVGASVLYVVGDTALRTRWAREAALPPSVRLLGIERPPLVGLVGVWLVLAALLDPGGYHDVRQLRRAEVDVEPKRLEQVFAEWRDRQPTAGVEGAVLPLVMVAASGGGLRSAYWTSLVLDCVLERETDPDTGDPCGGRAEPDVVEQRRNRLFALSGVGGGGLGVVSYDTHTEVDSTTGAGAWFDQRLSDDFLAPTMAWWLFRDTTATFLRPGDGRDSAAALERALERPWRLEGDALAEPLLTRQGGEEEPLLFLNAYSLEDGCRISTSIVATSGGRPINQCASLDPAFAGGTVLDGTIDLLDFLCPEQSDIRRSTAAVLGARFPWLTPAGRLVACGTDEQSPQALALDGGYLDDSGASTIVELWPDVQQLVDETNRAGTCVVPFFVQIDDHFDTLPPTPVSGSRTVPDPAVALRGVPGGMGDAARVAAQRTFTGRVDDLDNFATLDGQRLATRWARLAPRSEVGGGDDDTWVLADDARRDLQRQVVYNADTILQLRRVLDAADGTLGCEPGA